MHFSASSAFPDMEEVARELEKIERKYSPKTTKKHSKMPVELRDNLTVLSKVYYFPDLFSGRLFKETL